MYRQPEINFTPEEILMYLRKSQSDDPSLTVEEVLEKHEKILDDWAEQYLGRKIPEENKFREVVSGETIADRPEIQKILKMIESPKIKAALVVEPQRLTRGDLESIGFIMKIFKHSNTLVITPQMFFDLREEYDWDAFEMELKRGNDYLKYYKKIQARGKLASVSSGNYIGTNPPYGYDKIKIADGKKKCPTLTPNKDADTVRMIFDLYVNKNWGTQRICNYLEEMKIAPPRGKHWSSASLKDLISNIHYIGKVKWNWRKTITIVEDSQFKKTRPRMGEYLIFEGRHEGIVPEELYNAAQEKRGKNPRYPAKRKVANPFASILFCECGKSMVLRPYPHAKQRLLCLDKRHCKNGSCTYEDFAAKISEVLKQCIEDFEIRIKQSEGDSVKLHARLIKNLEKRMAELEKKELAQWEAQADPDPSVRMPAEIFKKLNEKLLAEKEEVQQALCKARESMPEPVDYEERRECFHAALEALNNPDVLPEEKNRLLKLCIDRITYKRGELRRLKDENGKNLKGKNGGIWNDPPFEIEVKLRV